MVGLTRTYKHVLTLSLIAFCALWLTPGFSEVGPIYSLAWFATFMLLFGSQVFWIGRILDLAERFIPGKLWRAWLGLTAAVLYVFLFFSYNFAPLKMLFTGHILHSSDPRFYRTLIDAVFSVWLVGSFIGFVLVALFWTMDRIARGATWAYLRTRRAEGNAAAPEPDVTAQYSGARRHVLRQMAIAVSAVPFGAAAYGLLYDRLNVEVTRRRIALARLPRSFEGFRIAQLSDFHISSFMTADDIRRCVTLTNQLNTDLVVLTGTTSAGIQQPKPISPELCRVCTRPKAYSAVLGTTRR
jgi:hypothetical protein